MVMYFEKPEGATPVTLEYPVTVAVVVQGPALAEPAI